MKFHRALSLTLMISAAGFAEGALIGHRILPLWLGIIIILVSGVASWRVLDRAAGSSQLYQPYQRQTYLNIGPVNYAQDEIRAAQLRLVLMSILSKENQQRLENKQALCITGSKGGQYLVRSSYTANVTGISGPDRATTYCAFAPINTNNRHLLCYMTMITQVLMLITDEAAFRRVARRREW